MLNLRHVQVNALKSGIFREKLPKLIPEIFSRLQQVDILAESDEPDGPLREPITKDMLMAQTYGISSINGLLQFCSYRFTVGEDWFTDQKIQGILNSSNLDEREKITAIEQHLPS